MTVTARPAWDRTTRVFHWINALCVLALAILGLAILNEASFGVSSEGKILLKTLHVYVGYTFVINLMWRLIWAFVGSPSARWKAILPTGASFRIETRAHPKNSPGSNERVVLGHNPLGRLMVSLLLLLLSTQALTGLVLAGTDLYMPPFGNMIADWVTIGDANSLANLAPGSKEFVDSVAYDDMRAFRKPIVTTHLYVFYILMIAIGLHIIGVVVGEFRERSGLISAMITGEKMIPDTQSRANTYDDEAGT
jgi:Ni/Fe-hydrogenase 1 B-type cytochrome subunit